MGTLCYNPCMQGHEVIGRYSQDAVLPSIGVFAHLPGVEDIHNPLSGEVSWRWQGEVTRTGLLPVQIELSWNSGEGVYEGDVFLKTFGRSDHWRMVEGQDEGHYVVSWMQEPTQLRRSLLDEEAGAYNMYETSVVPVGVASPKKLLHRGAFYFPSSEEDYTDPKTLPTWRLKQLNIDKTFYVPSRAETEEEEGYGLSQLSLEVVEAVGFDKAFEIVQRGLPPPEQRQRERIRQRGDHLAHTLTFVMKLREATQHARVIRPLDD